MSKNKKRIESTITEACVKKLLRQYEQNNKKKVTIINEGKFKDVSFDCHKIPGLNLNEDKLTQSNTEVICTGMEPQEVYILIAHAYIFQRISRNYKMSLAKKTPEMKIEQDLQYDAMDLRKFFYKEKQNSLEEGLEQKLEQSILLSNANELFIARRKELGSYANVLKVFSKLDEIEDLTLFALQKSLDRVDRKFTKGKNKGPQFIENFEKRNQAFLKTIETHCTPDTPCIAMIGDHHMQTHLYQSAEDVLSKFPVDGWAARSAEKVRDVLRQHAHKNPFAYLSPEEDVTDYPSEEPEDVCKGPAVRSCKSLR
ncbi:MAG: hypothetical protein WC748_08780 [Legionellales bacterium]